MVRLPPVSLETLINERGHYPTHIFEEASRNDPLLFAKTIRWLCAFANDFDQQGGGFIIFHKTAVQSLSKTREKIRRTCLNTLDPPYQPVMLMDRARKHLVLWAPVSDIRPHAVLEAEDYVYYRLGDDGPESIEVDEMLQRGPSYRQIPFDRQLAEPETLSAIDANAVRRFVAQHQTDLTGAKNDTMLRELALVDQVVGHNRPHHGALLLFSDQPSRLYPGAYIEMTVFSDSEGVDVLERRRFDGAIPDQADACLTYLEQTLVKQKVTDAPAYPPQSIREALMNALQHRSYEHEDPVRVQLFPTRIEITSYPGPTQLLDPVMFKQGMNRPPLPRRNAMISQWLERLQLIANHHSGVARMHRAALELDAPQPEFLFDRTYFSVRMHKHPRSAPLQAATSATALAKGDFLTLARIKISHLAATSQRERLTQALQASTLVSELDAIAEAVSHQSPSELPSLEQIARRYDLDLEACCAFYIGLNRKQAHQFLNEVLGASFSYAWLHRCLSSNIYRKTFQRSPVRLGTTHYYTYAELILMTKTSHNIQRWR